MQRSMRQRAHGVTSIASTPLCAALKEFMSENQIPKVVPTLDEIKAVVELCKQPFPDAAAKPVEEVKDQWDAEQEYIKRRLENALTRTPSATNVDGRVWINTDAPKAPLPIDGEVTALRWRLKQIAADVRGLRGHEFFREAAQPNCDHQEMIDNIVLAFRHLEDARMRLGKILQAHDGGTSCYDR